MGRQLLTKTVIVLQDLLRYDPKTGLVYLKNGTKGRKKSVEQPLGSLTKQGYLQTEVKGKQYKVHRLAWLLHYGKWPDGQIDHINKNKADNKIENLRCGNSVNQHNRDMPTGVSNLIGAHWNTRKQKYTSSIKIDGAKHHLGYFNCPTAAHLAYMVRKKEVLSV